MALFPLPAQPAHGRGHAGGPWHHRHASDHSKLGREIRAAFRQGDQNDGPPAAWATSGIPTRWWSASAAKSSGSGAPSIRMVSSSTFWYRAAEMPSLQGVLMRKLLTAQGRAPRVMITDKLRSYDAPGATSCPASSTGRTKGLSNRAENSHQPTRRRERIMKRSSHRASFSVSSPSMIRSPTCSTFAATHCHLPNIETCAPPPCKSGAKSRVSLQPELQAHQPSFYQRVDNFTVPMSVPC